MRSIHPPKHIQQFNSDAFTDAWYEIPDYEFYEVHPTGIVRNTITGKILKNQITQYGYYVVALSLPKPKKFLLHRLLALLFLDNPDNLPEINHIDGNRGNYNLTNLEWCNRTYNVQDTYKRGYIPTIKGKLKTYTIICEVCGISAIVDRSRRRLCSMACVGKLNSIRQKGKPFGTNGYV